MPRFVIPTLLLFCVCCKPAPESASNTDSLVVDSTDTYETNMDAPPDHVVISFSRDFVTDYTFEPFKKVYDASRVMAQWQSSMDHPDGLSHSDSVSMDSAMNKAYDLILQYKDEMKSGVTTPKQKGLVEPGTLANDDESFDILPESTSKSLNNGDFTFLGAAPFFSQDPELYKDASGNPETHYYTDMPANAAFFLNYIYSRSPGSIDITYGPPIYMYGGDQMHVKEIGSLKHNFQNRIPVTFMTTEGSVPAYVASVNLRLGDAYGCTSNLPTIEFAASKNIDPNSILGVFVSDTPLSTAKGGILPEVHKDLWEYDLDGDGSADIAGVISARPGEVMTEDFIMVAIWYVRINGDWVVLDYALQPECT
jgi:hypothetical protein